jgi:predicted RNA-binding protein with TRAM domain
MSYRRGRFGGSRFGGPKPVETGKEYDVQVTEISRKGDGVARVQGFIIFVKGGRVGQKTKVRVTHVGDRFATAETIGVGDEQQAQPQSTNQSKDIVGPSVGEEEKPELQDYKSSEAEEIKPEGEEAEEIKPEGEEAEEIKPEGEEQPPTGR